MTAALRDVQFHGLLYVADDAERQTNLKASADPLATYVACASLCARSFAHFGYQFSLVTNNVTLIAERTSKAGLPPIALRHHEFGEGPPRGTPFYSAHFKLQLMQAFSSGDFGERPGLVDIDTLLVRPFGDIDGGSDQPIGYDISAQAKPAVGTAAVERDIADLAGCSLDQPRWWGGEFIVADRAGYSALSAHIAELWPKYLSRLDEYHHIGDEMVTTTALALMAKEGWQIGDAGRAGGVARWWSSRTLAPQPPLSAVLDRSLLHLPADKLFLAAEAARPYDPARTLTRYRSWLWRKLVVRRLIARTELLVGIRSGKFVPRLRD